MAGGAGGADTRTIGEAALLLDRGGGTRRAPAAGSASRAPGSRCAPRRAPRRSRAASARQSLSFSSCSSVSPGRLSLALREVLRGLLDLFVEREDPILRAADLLLDAVDLVQDRRRTRGSTARSGAAPWYFFCFSWWSASSPRRGAARLRLRPAAPGARPTVSTRSRYSRSTSDELFGNRVALAARCSRRTEAGPAAGRAGPGDPAQRDSPGKEKGRPG